MDARDSDVLRAKIEALLIWIIVGAAGCSLINFG